MGSTLSVFETGLGGYGLRPAGEMLKDFYEDGEVAFKGVHRNSPCQFPELSCTTDIFGNKISRCWESQCEDEAVESGRDHDQQTEYYDCLLREAEEKENETFPANSHPVWLKKMLEPLVSVNGVPLPNDPDVYIAMDDQIWEKFLTNCGVRNLETNEPGQSTGHKAINRQTKYVRRHQITKKDLRTARRDVQSLNGVRANTQKPPKPWSRVILSGKGLEHLCSRADLR